MVLTDDQSAAAIITVALTPLAFDHIAAAALVDPAESVVPASERTNTNHFAIVDLAAGLNG